MAAHPVAFDRFSLKDPLVARTIADVCIGHGLSQNELASQRTIRKSASSACLPDPAQRRLATPARQLRPLWSQYQKLTQFLVVPDKIEIAARCDTRDEFIVLRDWCQWIENEAKNAALLMLRAPRHSAWKPPVLRSTLTEALRLNSCRRLAIRSREAVFDRLIYDVYGNPITFIRELIQNALDATRVQIYLDLELTAASMPAAGRGSASR